MSIIALILILIAIVFVILALINNSVKYNSIALVCVILYILLGLGQKVQLL